MHEPAPFIAAARVEVVMPLDPVLVPILEAMNAQAAPASDLPVSELRARAHAAMEAGFLVMGEDPPPVASVENHEVLVDGGTITVRVYRGSDDAQLPAHLYIHGGGFWLGTLDHFDTPCREIAAEVPCVVASVDYRLAPEHPFPIGPEDCYAALLWLVDNASRLGVDPSRITVGGGSAGGSLSAVVALMARDRYGPKLALQVLEIPATDCTLGSPSVVSNGEGYMLTKAGMEQCVGFYLADPDDAKHPYASPLLAEDLSELPPAVVVTAEFDPLRDEGAAYAQRLREAGVPVTYKQLDGHIHGSMGFTKYMASARDHRAMVIDAIRAAST